MDWNDLIVTYLLFRLFNWILWTRDRLKPSIWLELFRVTIVAWDLMNINWLSMHFCLIIDHVLVGGWGADEK